ncbi:hypothetical protein ABZ923_39345 [Streptomyces sp. NPDC046881]
MVAVALVGVGAECGEFDDRREVAVLQLAGGVAVAGVSVRVP